MSEKEKMSQNGTEETGKETKPAKAEKTKADKPKAKSDKEKKPGFFKRLGRFFRELKAELKKVAWPTRADTMKKTGVVILCIGTDRSTGDSLGPLIGYKLKEMQQKARDRFYVISG